MKALSKLLGLLALVFSVQAHSTMSDQVTVEGTVKSFDKKEVILVHNGYTFSVPREVISKDIKLEYNKHIEFEMNFDLVVPQKSK